MRGAFHRDPALAPRQLSRVSRQSYRRWRQSSSDTGIFQGLWHLKVFPDSDAPSTYPRTFWVLPYMMDETEGFPVPTLIALEEEMLERAKVYDLVLLCMSI